MPKNHQLSKDPERIAPCSLRHAPYALPYALGSMRIIFLGTNGWYDTQTGNTICILMESNDYYFILDAGNGLYKADAAMEDMEFETKGVV